MTNISKSPGKILGIDYGSIRIGIALSDITRTIAFGREVLENNPGVLKSLLKIIRDEDVKEIVIGYPLNMKGERSKQTIEVENFEKTLKDFLTKQKIEVNIVRWDERLTSIMAQKSIITSMT